MISIVHVIINAIMTMRICNKSIPLDAANVILGFSNETPGIASVSWQWNALAIARLERDYQELLAEEPLLAQKVTYLSSTPLTGPASKLQMIFLHQFTELMTIRSYYRRQEEMSWFTDPLFFPQWSFKYKRYLLYQLKTRENYPVEFSCEADLKIQLLKAHAKYSSDRFLVLDVAFFKAMRKTCTILTQTRCYHSMMEKFMPAHDENLNNFIHNIVALSQGFGGTLPFDLQKSLLDTIINSRCSSAFASFLKVAQEFNERPQDILGLVHCAVLDSNKQNCFDLLIQSYTFLKQSDDPAALKIEFSDGINPFYYTGDPAMIRFGVANRGYKVNTTALLLEAATSGNTDALDALLRLGAPVHKDHFSRAALNGYVWIVEKLLGHPGIKVKQRQTILHILAKNISSSKDAARLEPVIRVLMRHEADFDAADKSHQTPRDLLLKSPYISQGLRKDLTLSVEPPKKKIKK